MSELQTAKAIFDVSSERWEYGVMDCCQFAAKVVERLTGERLGIEHTYATPEEAQAIVQSAGSLRAVINRSIGGTYAERMVKYCKSGDPILVRVDRSLIAGVWPGYVMGIKFRGDIVVKTYNGVTTIPSSHAVCGWGVR